MTNIALLAFEMNTNSYNCISYKFSYLRHKYMGTSGWDGCVCDVIISCIAVSSVFRYIITKVVCDAIHEAHSLQDQPNENHQHHKETHTAVAILSHTGRSECKGIRMVKNDNVGCLCSFSVGHIFRPNLRVLLTYSWASISQLN